MNRREDLPGVARDASTLGDVLAAFEAQGHTGHFLAREGGRIECASCHECFAASDVDTAGLRRLEGASDPADMLAVAALRCPACGTAGTIVLGYGPEATIDDADVLLALDPPPAPDA